MSDLVMDVDTAATLNRRLAFAGTDGVRNARRCLDGIVQELTQGDTVDPHRLQQDATGAYRATLSALLELLEVANDLEPYAVLLNQSAKETVA